MYYGIRAPILSITNLMLQKYNYRPIPISYKAITIMATVAAISPSNIYGGNFLSLGVSKEQLLVDSFANGRAGGHRLRIGWEQGNQLERMSAPQEYRSNQGLSQV